MKRMTAAEALEAGYFRLHNQNVAMHAETRECVELFTPLESEMLSFLEDFNKVIVAAKNHSPVLTTLIKKARGE